MKIGDGVAWDVRLGAGRERRQGVVVFLRRDGDDDASLDATMRAAGWTGAVRSLRWRRKAGQLPDVVVMAPWSGQQGFFAPGIEELYVLDSSVAEVEASSVAEVEASSAAEVEASPAAEVGVVRPGSLRTLLRSMRRVAPVTSRPLALARIVPAEATGSVRFAPSSEPVTPPASPQMAPGKLTKESLEREIRRILDGAGRTRDEVYGLVRPLFVEDEFRFRSQFARAIDRLVAQRVIVRDWIETANGPMLGYLGR